MLFWDDIYQIIMNKSELNNVFLELKKNQNRIANTSYKERILKLKKLKKVLIEHKKQIQKALYEDFKKHPSEVDLTEVYPVTSEIKHNIKNLKNWLKNKKVKTPAALLGSNSYIKHEAKGVVLIITPWNFPINLSLIPLISAISAGNSIVLKPSEITENTSKVIKLIIEKTFEQNEVQVILGGPDVARNLLKIPFNHIYFTGSPIIGKVVMEAAAKNLASVTLELGGKSPTIVDNSCSIENAAKRIAWSKFINNGQICIAPDYILVHKSIKEKFKKVIISKIKEYYNEDVSKSSSYCRIVNKKHFNRVKLLLDDSIKNGDRVIYGGNYNEKENFIEPTIIEKVSEKSIINYEEIFGPLLPLFEYGSINEAISFINKKEKPLALYIYSRNKKSINKIINNTSSGGVCINHSAMHYSNSNLPFGGINNSGVGKSKGIYGFEEFSNKKSVLKQNLPSATDLMMPPYNDLKQKLIDFSIKWF